MVKQRLIRISLSLIFLASTTYAVADSEKKWELFGGAWFSVEYPPEFQVRPSLKSSTSIKGCDSAFFTSPDGVVEFYVFSPQWNGDPSDIAVNPETEESVSEKIDNKPDKIQHYGIKTVRWFTIAAKDKSYMRSYVDTENKDIRTRFVMGIKYRDQDVYNNYKEIYQRFVKSLRQYAD